MQYAVDVIVARLRSDTFHTISKTNQAWQFENFF
jgi:hypothetical protein